MAYNLFPTKGKVSIVELTKDEIKSITERTLTNHESDKFDVLQYGRVLRSQVGMAAPGDVVLYEKLAANRTNFGVPRQLVISGEHIHAVLSEARDAN